MDNAFFDARAEAKKIEGSAFSILREHARGQDTEYEQSELAKELASFWGDHNKRASVGAALQDDLKGARTLDWLFMVGERTGGSVDFDDRKILSGLNFELHSGKIDRDYPSMCISTLDSSVSPEINVSVGYAGYCGSHARVATAPLLNGDDDHW